MNGTEFRTTGGQQALLRFFAEIELIAVQAGQALHASPAGGFAGIVVLDGIAASDGAADIEILGDRTGFDRQTIVTTLRALEAAGAIAEVGEADATAFAITAGGSALRMEGVTMILPRVTALAKSVSGPDMIDTLPLLAKIRRHVGPSGA